MKKLYTSLFLICFSFLQWGFGQCPQMDHLVFYTQESVDAFILEYPDCTEFEGGVSISGQSITSLSGLGNLNSIGVGLWIGNTVALTNLTGLENLETIGGCLRIYDNDALSDLADLESLNTVGGDLWIEKNDALSSLNGLENLDTISGYVRIYDNDGLSNLSGLESLNTVGGYFNLSFNSEISTLSGLENLNNVGGDFSISSNNTLSTLTGLENLHTVGGNLSISYNNALSTLSSLESLDISGGLSINNNNSLVTLTGLENLNTIEGDLSIYDNDTLSSLTALENLSMVEGNFSIYNIGALSNLMGLENLDTIGGFLSISSNYTLSNLVGLDNLNSIGGHLSISGNYALSNLTGMENLNNIGGFLSITNNQALSTLAAFNNLNNIGGHFNIHNNIALANLTGLENLNNIGGNINIYNNDALQSVTSLNNLNYLSILELSITNNNLLSLCNTFFICHYLSTERPYNISNNSPDCENEEEILFSCGSIGKIHHPIFYDLNENGSKDSIEPFLAQASVRIEPNEYTSYGNNINGGLKYLWHGDHTISYNQNTSPLWVPTTPDSYDFTLDSLQNVDTVYFGLIPTDYISDFQVAIANDIPRCNEFVTFDIISTNSGTTIADGTLWLTIDEYILDVNLIDLPDTIVPPNRYGWHFIDLSPGQQILRQISLQIPGPPDFPIGEQIHFLAEIKYSDINGNHDNKRAHSITMECSYDPNDKSVSPIFPENYALIGEDLVYTVRFQNTGNAEAYDVVIQDELDPNLDLSTFQYISSSHEAVLSTFLEGNTITFEFRDIFLPDSTTSFDESQGYVMYSIRPYADVEDFTAVENTAEIYFDYNPAIVTNTTENVLLETFDGDGDGFELWVDCDDGDAEVNPAVTEIPYNGLDDDCDETTLDDDLDQDGFVLADDCDDNNAIVNPAAAETPYNGIDDDCDETTLDDDLDQDGFVLADDCDDENANVNPAAAETPYNGVDDDCDETTLDDDLDQDGFGIADDCDDNNALVNPAVAEIPYNTIDDDCDETTLDDDLDQDDFGIADDCDDENAAINPAAAEIPYNSTDDDCNEATLDDDLDQDGYGIAEDCDDENALVNPAVAETPYNSIDDDCDETTPDDDLDQDGYGIADDCNDDNPEINPTAQDIPNNGIDEDCDGEDAIVSAKDILTLQPQIYPNPTAGLLHIQFPERVEGTYELRSINGKLLLKDQLLKETRVNMTGFSGGVYLLLVKTGGGVWVERVVRL